MIDRYLIRYFLAVVDHGNFSRAAAQANVSQPTLSAGIAKLERTLGTRLFDRNNKRVMLTDAGRRLLGHARTIEQSFNLAETGLGEAGTVRTVRLGIVSTLATAMVSRIIQQFQMLGSGQPIEIVDGNAADLASRLDRGRIDIALSLHRPGLDRFRPEPIYSEGYMMILPPRHRMARETTVDAPEFANETMIVRRHCEALAETSRFFVDRSVRPHFALRTTSDERALAAVRAGLGVTVVPDSFIGDGMAAVRLAGFTQQRQVELHYAEHAQALRDAHSGIVRAIRSALQVEGAD
jgi:DNA-binding transcriptional LysR family regulator